MLMTNSLLEADLKTQNLLILCVNFLRHIAKMMTLPLLAFVMIIISIELRMPRNNCDSSLI